MLLEFIRNCRLHGGAEAVAGGVADVPADEAVELVRMRRARCVHAQDAAAVSNTRPGRKDAMKIGDLLRGMRR